MAAEISAGPTRLLRTLRAVRRYADRPIPDPVVLDILEVARWTGSSKNAQPWELVVVEDRAVLAALAELAPNGEHLARAALAVVQVVPSAQRAFDAGRQAERLMLAAWAHGVGACPASLFHRDNPRRGKALLGIPPTHRVTTIIGLGYPEDAPVRAAPADRHGRLRPGRRPLTDLVSWGRYGHRGALGALTAPGTSRVTTPPDQGGRGVSARGDRRGRAAPRRSVRPIPGVRTPSA